MVTETANTGAGTSRRTGQPTNLYLSEKVRKDGKSEALRRYGMSLSELVNALVEKELGLKRGLLRHKRR